MNETTNIILTTLGFCLITFLVAFYKYLTWTFNYWKDQGVPGDKPRIFIGTLKPYWKKRVSEQDIEGLKKYGRVYGGFEGRRPVLIISDPDLIRQVTIKDFQSFTNRRFFTMPDANKVFGKMLQNLRDEPWKEVRNILTPTFTTGKLKQMLPLIEECVVKSVEILENREDANKTIDVHEYFKALTIDVMLSCAFGVKIYSDTAKEFAENVKNIIPRESGMVYFIVLYPKILNFLPRKTDPFQYFVDIARTTIDMRLKSKETSRRDLLQIMLEASQSEEKTELSNQSSKRILTPDEIVAQCVLFLTGSIASISSTFACMAHSLATNSNVQKKLMNEIDEAMQKNNGKLEYNEIMELQYLDMVLAETLRMYPPGPRLDRCCNEDNYKLNGITLKKGIVVLTSVYALHYDPEFYPNPEKFDPMRFSPENKAKRDQFTYAPFGIGPRSCIAMRLALYIIKVAMIHVLSEFSFATCEDTDIPMDFTRSVEINPKVVKLLVNKRINRS